EWIQRLYAIATSASPTAQRSGICGVCLLQSFQMLAELQEYHSQGPLSAGGYFFDTAPNTDPFISFRQRYPDLNLIIENLPIMFNVDLIGLRLLVLATATYMLPQYEWIVSPEIETRPEMITHINSLINSPPGSFWLAMMDRQRPDGTIVGHAVPILRTSQGLVVMSTNWRSVSLDQYRQTLTPTMDPNQVIANLERPDRTLLLLITMQLGQVYHNPLDAMISNRNCTGEGEDRRGTGEYPSSASVNQCLGGDGRCVLSPIH
ncbi:DUF1561 family protein, partial [Leptospira interrogans]